MKRWRVEFYNAEGKPGAEVVEAADLQSAAARIYSKGLKVAKVTPIAETPAPPFTAEQQALALATRLAPRSLSSRAAGLNWYIAGVVVIALGCVGAVQSKDDAPFAFGLSVGLACFMLGGILRAIGGVGMDLAVRSADLERRMQERDESPPAPR